MTKRNLLESAITYLGSTSKFRIAHLVRLELASSTISVPVYSYLTDYLGPITYEGNLYQPGKVVKVGNIKESQGLTSYKLSISIAGEFQEELDRGLTDNSTQSYAGKDILVYRAYLDESGDIIPFDKTSNGPMHYFIGDITDISISEAVVTGRSTVLWQCSGKFQDFEAINGRITDDKSHRGLVSNGSGSEVPSTGAKLVSHQTDTGFQHANQTIELITKYMAEEKRYRLKKSGFLGLSKKLVETTVQVERTLELGLDLAAKYIPKIYGVRRVPGIPIFVDTLVDNPSMVYVVYAFAEGEIDSFLNLYLDGKSILCSSQADSDSRVCLGNMSNGDTISAFLTNARNNDVEDIFDQSWQRAHRYDDLAKEGITVPLVDRIVPSTPRDATEGTQQGDTFTILNETGVKWIRVYHGTSDQAACSELVSEAAAGNFQVQNSKGAGSEYWDSNSKLLDTAYIVMRFAITEEESELPELEAVISGNNVSTYDSNAIETTDQYSLNPVWHLLDYLKNTICGTGLPTNTIDLRSFNSVAAALDTQSTNYDKEFIKLWRYIGWKEYLDSNRQVMQCNTLIETKNTSTKNIVDLLRQFDGTLTMSGGLYTLSIENDNSSVADINIAEISGSLKTKDLSGKGKWNTVQAAIIDPAQGWNTNQVNFFNSVYLAEDKGVQKKGNIAFHHITNYYTARFWAERQLKKSRFSRQLTLTTYDKYTYLVPNDNVTITYDRFGYAQKKFRVKSVDLQRGGKVNLNLIEYSSDIYTDTNQPDAGVTEPVSTTISPPKNLVFIPLPSATVTIGSDSTIGTQGILAWDVSTDESSILRYEVQDWTGERADTHVAPSTTIDVSSIPKNFKKLDGLLPNTSYIFKVRSVSSSGIFSKYAFVRVITAGTVDPLEFSPITNFIAIDADDAGDFTGSDITMTWDIATDSITEYHIEIRSLNSSITYRDQALTKSIRTFTYTLAINRADYETLNAGALGAYRSFQIRIRSTNGLASNDSNFVSSEWVDLI